MSEQEKPAHRTRVEELKLEQAKKQLEKTKQIRQDLAIAFSTPEGKKALKAIAQLCGYNKTVIGGNPAIGMDVIHGTMYNSGRLAVYLELRAMVPSDILKQIEFENNEE